VTAADRQKARRALQRLSLSEAQEARVRLLLREDRREWEAARQLLAECRRELAAALARPVPDSAVVLELSVQERVLDGRERALYSRMEERMAGLLRPDQAARLRSLAPSALGDVLVRLCA
jgi:Spy/CpxP family protein refolding chaperone